MNKFRNVRKEWSKTILFVLALFSIVTLFSLSGLAQTQPSQPTTEAKPEVKVVAPKIIAAEFYADWCAACKELMPRIADLKKSYPDKGILVVRFDMTDEYTKAQASFMASYSGLEEAYKKGNGRTGLIALIDVKTKQIYGVITKTKTIEEITKMVDDAISKADSSK